jgi:hypothetical protein
MRRILVVLLGVLVVVIAAGQLLVPGIAERKVEHRLERHGGSAKVAISAFPAARLLFHHGDSLTVRGHGLRLDTEERQGDLGRLDGFDKVSVELTDTRAGPMHLSTFNLHRGEGDRRYSVRMTGTTSPAEVGSFLGGALGGLAGGILPGGTDQLPVRARATLESRDGKVEVTSASGTVAGIPADPLVQFVAATVAARL